MYKLYPVVHFGSGAEAGPSCKRGPEFVYAAGKCRVEMRIRQPRQYATQPPLGFCFPYHIKHKITEELCDEDMLEELCDEDMLVLFEVC